MLKEGPGEEVDSRNFRGASRFFVSQHFKVVLEHVDQLVRLEGFLDSIGDTVDKLLESFGCVGIASLCLLLHLLKEVLRVVLNYFIHQTVVRCLSLKALHLISGLQTDLEDLLLGEVAASLNDLDFGT